MKIGAIIQARMGSTRLPGKVLKQIKDKTVLEHEIQRVMQSRILDTVIIATTQERQDDKIVNVVSKLDVEIFRGDEYDVLSRYYFAAVKYSLDVVVRITADCPLIDSKIIDEVIEFYLMNDYPIVTNAGENPINRTYPRGLDIEVFSFEKLEEAYSKATKDHQREHVTPYIYENHLNCYFYKNDKDYSQYRWTLDTEEDFLLIYKIYEGLYKGKHNFYLNEIIDLLSVKPELNDINAHVEQKKYSNY